MQKIMKKFEKIIVMTLLVLMMLAVLVSAIELSIILVKQVLAPPFPLLDIKEILEVFGFFLMVLIGLELLETISSYLKDSRVHVEVVFLVALVAVLRKVIILDYYEIQAPYLLGIAALILSISTGYFLVKFSLNSKNNETKD